MICKGKGSCGIDKPAEDFSKGRNICKSCVKIQNKLYKEKNKASLKEKRKQYLENGGVELKNKIKEQGRKYRSLNKEQIALERADYWQANKDSIKTQRIGYYATWKEAKLSDKAFLESQKIYRMEHPIKECYTCRDEKAYNEFLKYPLSIDGYKSNCKSCSLALGKIWRQNNPSLVAFYSAKRRSDIIDRTPRWLDKEDFEIIQWAYEEAKEKEKKYGVQFHVDHVIPLKGKYVSGFHCPENLRIIPWYENLEKGNKFDCFS